MEELIPITNHNHNYLQWSQFVMLFIYGKGKDDYLTDELVLPDKADMNFRKWKVENRMVLSWLINSMNKDIG